MNLLVVCDYHVVVCLEDWFVLVYVTWKLDISYRLMKNSYCDISPTKVIGNI